MLNQTVFAGGCSIPHHFSIGKFVDVVRRNYLLVILKSEKVKRSLCFFLFFSVFQKLSHEAHAGSIQLIINTNRYPNVKI